MQNQTCLIWIKTTKELAQIKKFIHNSENLWIGTVVNLLQFLRDTPAQRPTAGTMQGKTNETSSHPDVETSHLKEAGIC